MSDIDLIPQDYRQWLEHRAILRRAALAFVAANAVVLLCYAALSHLSAESQARVIALQSENAVTQQQQQQLQQLESEQDRYEKQWSLLQGLRAGAEIKEIFLLIDRSLTDDRLWFLDWSFRRASVTVDGQQIGADTEYVFIVTDTDGQLRQSNLEVETHMTIRGQARDHQALSTFVRALFEQNDVKDVNVRKTSQTDYANGRVVEFDMAVVLQSSLRDS